MRTKEEPTGTSAAVDQVIWGLKREATGSHHEGALGRNPPELQGQQPLFHRMRTQNNKELPSSGECFKAGSLKQPHKQPKKTLDLTKSLCCKSKGISTPP